MPSYFPQFPSGPPPVSGFPQPQGSSTAEHRSQPHLGDFHQALLEGFHAQSNGSSVAAVTESMNMLGLNTPTTPSHHPSHQVPVVSSAWGPNDACPPFRPPVRYASTMPLPSHSPAGYSSYPTPLPTPLPTPNHHYGAREEHDFTNTREDDSRYALRPAPPLPPGASVVDSYAANNSGSIFHHVPPPPPIPIRENRFEPINEHPISSSTPAGQTPHPTSTTPVAHVRTQTLYNVPPPPSLVAKSSTVGPGTGLYNLTIPPPPPRLPKLEPGAPSDGGQLDADKTRAAHSAPSYAAARRYNSMGYSAEAAAHEAQGAQPVNSNQSSHTLGTLHGFARAVGRISRLPSQNSMEPLTEEPESYEDQGAASTYETHEDAGASSDELSPTLYATSPELDPDSASAEVNTLHLSESILGSNHLVADPKITSLADRRAKRATFDEFTQRLTQQPRVKKALCIGISYSDARRAGHRDCEGLLGSINDAKAVAQYLKEHCGYAEDMVTLLVDEDTYPENRKPTRANILRALNWLVQDKDREPNDHYFFFYSGHGTQVKDVDGDEADGLDEAIIPMDFYKNQHAEHILDDRLHATLVKPLPPSCSLTAVIDCCHSGSMLDLPYSYTSEGTSRRDSAVSKDHGKVKNSHARVVCLSSCKDSQESDDYTTNDGRFTGLFTYAFLKALEGNRNPTLQQLLNSVRSTVSLLGTKAQKPQISSSALMDLRLESLML